MPSPTVPTKTTQSSGKNLNTSEPVSVGGNKGQESVDEREDVKHLSSNPATTTTTNGRSSDDVTTPAASQSQPLSHAKRVGSVAQPSVWGQRSSNSGGTGVGGNNNSSFIQHISNRPSSTAGIQFGSLSKQQQQQQQQQQSSPHQNGSETGISNGRKTVEDRSFASAATAKADSSVPVGVASASNDDGAADSKTTTFDPKATAARAAQISTGQHSRSESVTSQTEGAQPNLQQQQSRAHNVAPKTSPRGHASQLSQGGYPNAAYGTAAGSSSNVGGNFGYNASLVYSQMNANYRPQQNRGGYGLSANPNPPYNQQTQQQPRQQQQQQPQQQQQGGRISHNAQQGSSPGTTPQMQQVHLQSNHMNMMPNLNQHMQFYMSQGYDVNTAHYYAYQAMQQQQYLQQQQQIAAVGQSSMSPRMPPPGGYANNTAATLSVPSTAQQMRTPSPSLRDTASASASASPSSNIAKPAGSASTTPVPTASSSATSVPQFSKPPKRSAAIKIFNPATKSEVVLPPKPAAPEPKTAALPPPSASPSQASIPSSASPAPRPSSAASAKTTPVPNVASVSSQDAKERQDALRKRIQEAAEAAGVSKPHTPVQPPPSAVSSAADVTPPSAKVEETPAAPQVVPWEPTVDTALPTAKEVVQEDKAEAPQAEVPQVDDIDKPSDVKPDTKVTFDEKPPMEMSPPDARTPVSDDVGTTDIPSGQIAEATAPDEPEVFPEEKDEATREPVTEVSASDTDADRSNLEEHQLDSLVAALGSSRFVISSSSIKYPEGVTSPKSSANSSNQTRHIYDMDFLLQFKTLFKGKPSVDWDERYVQSIGGPSNGMRSTPSSAGLKSAKGHVFEGMGTFGTGKLPNMLTSTERFRHSNRAMQAGANPAISAASGMVGGFQLGSNFRPNQPGRAISSNSVGGLSMPNSPSRKSRTISNKREKSHGGSMDTKSNVSDISFEPLPVSENRWKPQKKAEPALGHLPGVGSADGNALLAPDVVQRKVKSLLNKLTLEKFDKITDQILGIASQSKNENDGQTLRQVIQLTFEKATDEPNFSAMYARFCRKMMETIDPEIRDPNLVSKEGKPLTGGQLFRKYLLNRCQEEFERGWRVNPPPKPDGAEDEAEAELLSEEYYIAAAAKRRGLGLIQFIGELYKLEMLIEKIMHECIKRLLRDINNPEEEEIESLCKLLNTVGADLEAGKGSKSMDIYYSRLEDILKSGKLISRINFMILDVLELRKNGWKGRGKQQKGPSTLAEIHETAAKEKLEAEAARYANQSRPRDNRQQRNMDAPFGSRPNANTDEWNTVKNAGRTGDMSRLGMIRTSSSTNLGQQTSGFSSLRSSSGRRTALAGVALAREESASASSRAGTPTNNSSASASHTNMFDLLHENADHHDDQVSASSSLTKSQVAAASSQSTPKPTPTIIPAADGASRSDADATTMKEEASKK